ncbi:nucleotidyltransferase domain-containing protein [Candidatus Uhrbacteria bacterium]|nr:nucleotidyltransferase domain-containing protein [Candidatus Uhrbacteria bacterium]
MQLQHYPVEKLKEQIANIVGWYLDRSMYRVFFFGSRVQGNAASNSDIDVGIDGPAPIPPRTMSAIRDAITSIPVRRRIDVVDFQTVGDEFRSIALRHTEPIP